MTTQRAAWLVAFGTALLFGCAPTQQGLPNAPIFNTGVRATIISPGQNAPPMPGQGTPGGYPGGPGAPPPGSPSSAYGSPYGGPSDLAMLGGAVTVDTREIKRPRNALSSNPILWPFAAVAWPFKKVYEGVSNNQNQVDEQEVLDRRAQAIVESGGAPIYHGGTSAQMAHEQAQVEAMQRAIAEQQGGGTQLASRGGSLSIAQELEALRRRPSAATTAPLAAADVPTGAQGADSVEDRDRDGRPDHWTFGSGRDRTREVFDDDGDGRPDRTVHYASGGEQVARVEQDGDGDGAIDSWVLYEDGHMVQRRADTNADGKVDTWTFYDAAGNITRQAQDVDGDGNRDRAEVFENGKLASRTEDTNGDGNPDRVTRFDASGRPVEQEEDKDGDGEADVRSFYTDGRLVKRQLLDGEAAP